jgi:phosphatidylserine/phosphatidylglycerophosphate/cardiolipin synthase-like enzyme
MTRDELAAALAETFEDFCMSRSERHAMRELFDDFQSDPETLNFARNRAFDLVQTSLRESPDHGREAVHWLEEVVKGIDAVKDRQIVGSASVHFSPGNYCANQVIWLIRAARSSIDACVFTIADDRISDQLLAAHQRGIRVRIISDDDKSRDHGSDIRRFVEAGISVRTDDSPAHMHHKFAIFDGRVLVNGSFNWTRSASQNNQENLVTMADPPVVASFAREFAKLWDACIPR